MTKNMSTTDKVIRILIAVVVAFLYYNGTINGTIAILLGLIAVIFTLTSLISFCPLYSLFGFSTNKKN
ncbi:MAG: DUF2892 domain-containing protein [Saprospiraceae bacterium]|jgi:hypothetical protein|nr:DUF2892 domain-containing protein [Saprospiraceae bacterium]MBL0027421.1 DUF2892 domain-containing protein [Saprospiraceae bacterium]